VVFGHALAHGQSPHGEAIATPATPALPTPIVVVSPTKPATPAKPKRPAHHHHRVAPDALTVTDLGPACYIQVTTMQGHLVVRRILHDGQHLAFRHHGLEVVLGNAGGVRVSIDGHHAHRAGRSGQVRTFTVR
jgi:Domain of unknown function (DUF4115)